MSSKEYNEFIQRMGRELYEKKQREKELYEKQRWMEQNSKEKFKSSQKIKQEKESPVNKKNTPNAATPTKTKSNTPNFG